MLQSVCHEYYNSHKFVQSEIENSQYKNIHIWPNNVTHLSMPNTQKYGKYRSEIG